MPTAAVYTYVHAMASVASVGTSVVAVTVAAVVKCVAICVSKRFGIRSPAGISPTAMASSSSGNRCGTSWWTSGWWATDSRSGWRSTGDVVPVGRRGFPTQKRAPDVPAGQYVTCYWPVFITFYENGKFNELQNMAADAGCTVKLEGRFSWHKKEIVA